MSLLYEDVLNRHYYIMYTERSLLYEGFSEWSLLYGLAEKFLEWTNNIAQNKFCCFIRFLKVAV